MVKVLCLHFFHTGIIYICLSTENKTDKKILLSVSMLQYLSVHVQADLLIADYWKNLVILTTPENSITYDNTLCLSPQILHKRRFQFLLGLF